MTALPMLALLIGILIWAVMALVKAPAAADTLQAAGGRRSSRSCRHALVGEDHQLLPVQVIVGEICRADADVGADRRPPTDTVPA